MDLEQLKKNIDNAKFEIGFYKKEIKKLENKIFSELNIDVNNINKELHKKEIKIKKLKKKEKALFTQASNLLSKIPTGNKNDFGYKNNI